MKTSACQRLLRIPVLGLIVVDDDVFGGLLCCCQAVDNPGAELLGEPVYHVDSDVRIVRQLAGERAVRKRCDSHIHEVVSSVAGTTNELHDTRGVGIVFPVDGIEIRLVRVKALPVDGGVLKTDYPRQGSGSDRIGSRKGYLGAEVGEDVNHFGPRRNHDCEDLRRQHRLARHKPVAEISQGDLMSSPRCGKLIVRHRYGHTNRKQLRCSNRGRKRLLLDVGKIGARVLPDGRARRRQRHRRHDQQHGKE